MIEPLLSSSGSVVPREPALERGQLEVPIVHRPVGLAPEVDRGHRSVDQRCEVRSDRRRELGGVAEVRRDVGEVLDRVRVISLAQERANDPVSIARKGPKLRSAVTHRAAQVREVAVLVAAVFGMVPADEVEQLVAGRELDLPKSLVGLDAGSELDLVAIRIEAAAAPGVRPNDPAAPTECPNLFGEAAEGALDQHIPWCHIQISPAAPERPSKVVQPTARQALDRRKHGAPVSDHEPSIRGAEQEFRSEC